MDRLVAAPAETRVVLRCDGGYVGEVINARWLRVPCRQKRCREVGDEMQRVVHTWDLLTGRRTTVTEASTLTGSAPLSAAPDP